MKQTRRQTRERRISAALRITLAAVLLLLNILAIMLLVSYLRSNAALIFLFLQLAGVITAINIQSCNDSMSYKLAWTLLVVSLPVTGLILYLLWGGNFQTKRLALLTSTAPPGSVIDKATSQANLERINSAMPHWRRTASLLEKRNFRLYRETDVTYFPSGEAFFTDVIHHMEHAQRFIFLEFFIMAEGKLWERMQTILKERAAQGVEVKIIFDDFGSMTRMSKETVEHLRQAGIDVVIFNPVHQYVNRLYFNYRDHRKIVAIDGQYAYTGGVNIADEYVGFIRRFGEWKDCGIRLDGSGTWGLTSRFIHMWEMLGHKLYNEHDYYRPLEARRNTGWCQPFSDGPLNNPDNPAEDIFLQCIHNAHDYIWLTTPYFVVEDSIIRALCTAADSGVDVRLMLPGIPDHKYTDIVAGSYYERLLSHGVKIYRFQPGFLHAKTFIADGDVAMVGTINMDYRSFQLHYECGVMLYGIDAISDIRKDLEQVIQHSKAVDLETWRKRSCFRHIAERILKIFSIWM
ncbi:MAG: cardiolipin synthase [Oscillospiraceae bacterium]|nr:cardiolipin synthase [Oscillospiraceae bacterium]